MKIRSNFVSNSSSSSFIVQFKDFESYITVAGEKFYIIDFFDYIRSRENDSSFETDMHEITYDDDDRNSLIQYIDYQLQYESSEEIIEKLINLKNDIKNINLNFARFDLSYHDKAGNFLLKLLQKYGLFTVRDTTEK